MDAWRSLIGHSQKRGGAAELQIWSSTRELHQVTKRRNFFFPAHELRGVRAQVEGNPAKLLTCSTFRHSGVRALCSCSHIWLQWFTLLRGTGTARDISSIHLKNRLTMCSTFISVYVNVHTELARVRTVWCVGLESCDSGIACQRLNDRAHTQTRKLLDQEAAGFGWWWQRWIRCGENFREFPSAVPRCGGGSCEVRRPMFKLGKRATGRSSR